MCQLLLNERLEDLDDALATQEFIFNKYTQLSLQPHCLQLAVSDTDFQRHAPIFKLL